MDGMKERDDKKKEYLTVNYIKTFSFAQSTRKCGMSLAFSVTNIR